MQNYFKIQSEEPSILGSSPHIRCQMIDYYQNGSRDLVISVSQGTLNHGTYIFLEHDKTKGVPNSIPVYDHKNRVELAGIKGKMLASIPRSDGIYDLLFHHGGLKLYKNSGTAGHPRFDGTFEDVLVGGVPLGESIAPAEIKHLAVYNDAKGKNNLIISVAYDSVKYWPASFCARGEGEHPICGQNRGYDENGIWLGSEYKSKIFVAQNLGEEPLSYASPVEIYETDSIYLIDAGTIITENGRQYLCVNKDVDKIYQAEYKDQKLLGPLTESACSPIKQSYMLTFSTADIDNDGNDEILLGSNPGMSFWMDFNDGVFEEKPPFMAYNGFVWGESLVVPCLADTDNDGDLDLILADASGFLWYYENTSSKRDEFAFKPGIRLATADGEIIHQQAGYHGAIQGPKESRWGYLKAYAVDWDGDGLVDVITNNISGQYMWYKNIGDKENFLLAKPVPLLLDGKPFISSTRSRFGIWSDGKLVVVNGDGYLQFYERDPKDVANLKEGKWLRYKDGGGIKVSGSSGYSGRAVIFACDWDEDGKTDLLGGTLDYNMRYINRCFPHSASPFFIKNIGTDENPVFERPVLITKSSGEILDFYAHECSVWAADINADGRLDLINGAEDGRVYYWHRDELRWDHDCAKDFTKHGR